MRLASFISTLIFVVVCEGVKYQPTWASLDTRPLPQWFDDAKIGISIHWGVYSVPAFGNENFWTNLKRGDKPFVQFMHDNYPPGYSYQEFANDFKAKHFDPNVWADIFKKSGAKYVVITSKHHDGYTLWPSSHSYSWNAKEIGPHRDLLGDLANALRTKTDLKFGVYYSLLETFNPMFLADQKSNFRNNSFVIHKVYPELVELVEKYRPEVIWSQGIWAGDITYWKSLEFLSWLYNESPVKDTVVVNDRWGYRDVICKHGDYFTCDPGEKNPHKWSGLVRIDGQSYSHRNHAKIGDYATTVALLGRIVDAVSKGGNIMLNIGPTSDGVITSVEEERLLDIGKWLGINGEAIYGSKPWIHRKDSISNVLYTMKGSAVYAIVLTWPSKNVLKLASVANLFKNNTTVVSLLGQSGQLDYTQFPQHVEIKFPYKSEVRSELVWVVKIEEKKA